MLPSACSGDIDHVLPFDKRVMAAANCGVPIAMAALRFSGYSRGLERLADDVAGGIGEVSPRAELAESPLVVPETSIEQTTSIDQRIE